ncbi:MAG: sigma 54-interacting transcriptional regulator [Myxococcales bacterium]|nr:sigma 54-interacting transcriptional regulator [Myxococcales bacterium]
MTDKIVETVRLEPRDEPAPSGRWRVVVVGEGTNSSYALPLAGAATVGRGDDVEIRLGDDAAVSRRHAQLVTSSEGMRLIDLGSANGTSVRGRKLAANEQLMLSAGDSFEVGTSLLVVQPDRLSGASRPWTLLDHASFVDRLEETRPPFAVLRLQVLAEPMVAQEVLLNELSSHDTVASFGPGQYEVLTPGRAPDGAQQLLTRLSARLVERGARVRAGAAHCPADGSSAEALFAACVRPASAPAPGFVVRDDALVEIHRQLDKVAQSNINVLLLGETGVGKEVLAKSIHERSKRKGLPMTALNCAALSETLLESELFGHLKGSFTGAVKDKEGVLVAAKGSTVFLDEVGELPPSIQVKLLRVLEERRVLPVGAVTPVAIDVRFVFATNRDLEAEVARGAFRSDLFYRINGIAVTIPPLRERPSEIEELARKFAADGAARDEVAVPEFSPQAIAALKTWPWPGNIRELKNAVDRALLMAPDGTITPAALGLGPASSPGRPAVGGPEAAPSGGAPNLKSKRAEAEKKAVLEALELTEGNRTRAARVLGISRRTLVSRLQEYGINKPRQGSDEPGSGEQGA